MTMAGILKGKLLASFVRVWDAASTVLNALAICNCFATSMPREESRLAQQTLPLPEELIVEILSWVPVKALMRFRCISKTWNSLIFHPTFVKLHLQRSSKNTYVLLHFNEDMNPMGRVIWHVRAAPCSMRGLLENPSSTIDDCCHRFNRYYFVFGACNGLVCLHDSFVGDEFQEHRVQFWNPATRIMSEDSPRLRVASSNYKIRLLGFGFDDWSDTYKAVIMALDTKSQNLEVRVHCLGDTCWRNVLTWPAIRYLGPTDGHLAGGALNWLALRNLSSRYEWETVTIDQLVIFSYDLRKETCKYLLIPDGLREVPSIQPRLQVLNGYLCLSHDHKRTHFVVWLMREFGVEKSWTHLLNVSYEHLHVLPPCQVKLLCVSENEDYVLFRDSKFVLYNKRDNRIDRIEDFKDKFSLFSYDYVQSLVLPY